MRLWTCSSRCSSRGAATPAAAGTSAPSSRVIGVRHGDAREHHWYVTNVPVTVLSPTEIATTYAARWDIELVFRDGGHTQVSTLAYDPRSARLPFDLRQAHR